MSNKKEKTKNENIGTIETVEEQEYVLAVTWEYSGYVRVKGTSLLDAMNNFNNNIDNYPIPTNTEEYVDDSYRLSTEDVEEMREATIFHNGNKR